MSVTQREAARAYAGLAVELAKLHAAMASGQNVDLEALGQNGDRMDRLRELPFPVGAPQRSRDGRQRRARGRFRLSADLIGIVHRTRSLTGRG